MVRKLQAAVRLLRARHWLKNVVIFIPVVFSGQLGDREAVWRVIGGTVIFNLVASAVYIVNDMSDAEEDRKNPAKCSRPLASGALSRKEAAVILFALAVLAARAVCGLGYGFEVYRYYILYVLINLAYSKGLKDVALADVFLLAQCYMVRLYLGGELAGAAVSDWVFLTVMAGALYLGMGKRRNELRLYGTAGGRKVLGRYSVLFLDKGMQMFLTMAIIFYALACADGNTAVGRSGADILWSVPLVAMALLRYDMLAEEPGSTGDPIEVIYGDKLLVGLALLYGVTVVAAIYVQ